MKLNARILYLAHMVWFIYNLNTIFYQHNVHTEAHAHTPFGDPLLLHGNPSPPIWSLSLTYLEIPPCSGVNSHPLLPLVGSKLNPPSPLLSPSLTPTVPLCSMHVLSGRHYDIGFTQSDTGINILIIHPQFCMLHNIACEFPHTQHLHVLSVHWFTHYSSRDTECSPMTQRLCAQFQFSVNSL